MSQEVSKSGTAPELSYSIDEPSSAVEALSADTANVTSHLLNVQAREFEIAQWQQ